VKRKIALLLAVIMIASLLPTQVFANVGSVFISGEMLVGQATDTIFTHQGNRGLIGNDTYVDVARVLQFDPPAELIGDWEISLALTNATWVNPANGTVTLSDTETFGYADGSLWGPGWEMNNARAFGETNHTDNVPNNHFTLIGTGTNANVTLIVNPIFPEQAVITGSGNIAAPLLVPVVARLTDESYNVILTSSVRRPAGTLPVSPLPAWSSTFEIMRAWPFSDSLPAPTGLEIDDRGILTWDAVEGAREYFLYVDGELMSVVTFSPFNLNTLDFWQEGVSHQVQLRASNWPQNSNSPLSDYVIFTVPSGRTPLSAPTGLSINNGVLRWNAVENAMGYVILADGDNVMYLSSEYYTSFSLNWLSEAEHYIQMIALGSGSFLNSPPSDGITWTRTRLLPPTNLEIDDRGMLSWDEAEGATWYSLLIDGARPPLGVGLMGINSPFNLNALGLQEGQSYQVQLIASNPSQYVASLPSTSATFTVQADRMSLPAPTGLFVDDEGFLQWNEVENATGYEILVNFREPVFSITQGSSNTSFFIDSLGLSAGSSYIQVRATGGGAFSNSVPSQDITVTANQLPPPNGLKISDDGMLSWNDSENAVAYQLFINDRDAGFFSSYWINIQSSPFNLNTLDLLREGRSYQVQLRATGVFPYISSFLSDSVIFTISSNRTPLQPPTNVEVRSDGFLSWNAVEGATGYRIFVDGELLRSILAEANPSSYLHRLTYPIKEHSIRVVAIGGGSFSNSAPSQEVIWEITRLPAPTGLRISDRGMLTWDVPEGHLWHSLYVDGVERMGTFSPSINLNTLDFLQDGQSYKVQLRAHGFFPRPYEDSLLSDYETFTIPSNRTQLPEPTGLSIARGFLSWNAVEGATDYVILVNGIVKTLTHLEVYYERSVFLGYRDIPAGENRIQVVAIGGGTFSNSEPSQPYIWSLTALQAPTGLYISDRGILSWNEVEGVEYYSLYIDNSTHGFGISSPFNLNILGLEEGRSYQVQVRALNPYYNADSPHSFPETFTIQSGRTPLPAPTNLSVDDDRILRWNAVENATGYIMSIDGPFWDWAFVFAEVNPSFDLDGRGIPIGEHRVRVQAIGGGSFSNSELSEGYVIFRVEALPPEIIYTNLELSFVAGGIFHLFRAVGTGEITWSIAEELPEGLEFDSRTGHLSGLIREEGTFNLTVTASSIHGYDTRTFVVTIHENPFAPPVITYEPLPDGVVGQEYSATLRAEGIGQIIWSITEGRLPDGLDINPLLGKITGLPTTAGTFRFTVTASDPRPMSEDSREFEITIVLPDPTSVRITPHNDVLLAVKPGGEPLNLTADVHPVAALQDVVWRISEHEGVRFEHTDNGINLFADENVVVGTEITVTVTVAGTDISSSVPINVAAQLSAPTNLRISGTTLSWDEVENAIGYRIYVGGVARTSVGTTSFNLATLNPGLGVGTHGIQVRAISYFGTDFSSELSSSINFVVQAATSGGGGGGGGGTAPPLQQAAPVVEEEEEEEYLEDVDVPLAAFISFLDINITDWFHNAVLTVVSQGLFQGVSDTNFAPNAAMNRAMFATVLSRLAGANLDNSASNGPSFDDVSQSGWYFAAVEWATELGVVQGIGGNNFAPNASITREQIAVMLYRYVSMMDIELQVSEGTVFIDQASVSDWAVDAVRAIQAAGIVTGRPDGSFDPQATATRAEVATIFARFLDALE